MKRKIKVEQEVEITYANCYIFPWSFETSEVNGESDNDESPKMPLAEMEHDLYIIRYMGGKPRMAWRPYINLNTGKIENWTQGTTASVHYKSVDGNIIQICDDDMNIIKEYEGYVPNFLCPKGSGYGDYVIMDIDENGFIKDFNNNLDDIFEEDD